MHELSLSLKTIDMVVEHAQRYNKSQVTGITLCVGALSCIEHDALRTGLEFAARETLAENAVITIETIPATGRCQECGKSVSIRQHYDACPHCHSYQLSVETGEELKVKHIEVI